MIQRKSEFNPTIIRRLQYQNKDKLAYHHQSGFQSKLLSSVSAPLSPRKIANLCKQGMINRTSSNRIFDDDTQIDYNYTEMDIENEEEMIICDFMNDGEEEEEKEIITVSPRLSRNNRLKLQNTTSCPTQSATSDRLRVRNFSHRKHSSLDDDDPTHSIQLSVISVPDDFISSKKGKKSKYNGKGRIRLFLKSKFSTLEDRKGIPRMYLEKVTINS